MLIMSFNIIYLEIGTIIILIFCFGHAACGILVTWPGIVPAPPALEVWNLNSWIITEVPILILKDEESEARRCSAMCPGSYSQ